LNLSRGKPEEDRRGKERTGEVKRGQEKKCACVIVHKFVKVVKAADERE